MPLYVWARDVPQGRTPGHQHCSWQPLAVAAIADVCGRDAVTAPAITPLDTWEGLEPLALSSHVLLDMKTIPVKSHFRIVIFTYATVDKQNLVGLYFNDKLCVLQQVFFVSWFYFPPSTKGNFYLRERRYRRRAASYLKSQNCLAEADRHESSQWMQYRTQVAFFTNTRLLSKGWETCGVHCSWLMCGWVPRFVYILADGLQLSWCYCQERCKQKETSCQLKH